MRKWPGTSVILLAVAPPLLAAQAGPAASPQAKEVVIERVTVDELKKLMASDKVLVLDVRGAEAYKDAHIPGSVSIPLGDIETHVKELKSAKKPIVTYCS